MVRLGELVVILDLHQQGLSVSAIARRVGIDHKTVRKYIARGLKPPVYQARQPRPSKVNAFVPYLRERVAAYPDLTSRRLHREINHGGGYTVVKEFLRAVRPGQEDGRRPGLLATLAWRTIRPAVSIKHTLDCSNGTSIPT